MLGLIVPLLLVQANDSQLLSSDLQGWKYRISSTTNAISLVSEVEFEYGHFIAYDNLTFNGVLYFNDDYEFMYYVTDVFLERSIDYDDYAEAYFGLNDFSYQYYYSNGSHTTASGLDYYFNINRNQVGYDITYTPYLVDNGNRVNYDFRLVVPDGANGNFSTQYTFNGSPTIPTATNVDYRLIYYNYSLRFSSPTVTILDKFLQYDQTIVYDKGFADGFNNGHDVGFTEGWDKGFLEGSTVDTTVQTIFNGILNVALVPINFFLAIFNFEILGINISAMVSALLSLAILIIVIRLVLGGKNGQ